MIMLMRFVAVSIVLSLLHGPSFVGAGLVGRIRHVVVLMLENRSFDHMLGQLKRTNSKIEGCTGDATIDGGSTLCTNPMDPLDPTSVTVPVTSDAVYIQPADPSHSTSGTAEQVFGFRPASEIGGGVAPEEAPMSGFIRSYQDRDPSTDGASIMASFDPAAVPAISTLAKEFAVFNNWFSSIPGPTEVNRAYLHTGTSFGYASNNVEILIPGFPQKTIFEQLDEAGASWRVNFMDAPTSLLLKYTRRVALSPLSGRHFASMRSFFNDAASGDLANYTFLEPRYLDTANHPANDQHPNHDVGEGDHLIKRVYDALRQGPKWNETLFVVTYDEHGGFFDHVSPPACPNPDGMNATDDPFDFSRLGVRVPTLMASPWIERGTVVSDGVFEHSSVPKTLRNLFAPDAPPLTDRDEWASAFDGLFGLRDEPREDCPENLPTPTPHRKLAPATLPTEHELGTMPVSDLQSGMIRWLDGLVTANDVQLPAEAESSGVSLAIENVRTEGEAAAFVRNRVNALFGREIVEV